MTEVRFLVEKLPHIKQLHAYIFVPSLTDSKNAAATPNASASTSSSYSASTSSAGVARSSSNNSSSHAAGRAPLLTAPASLPQLRPVLQVGTRGDLIRCAFVREWLSHVPVHPSSSPAGSAAGPNASDNNNNNSGKQQQLVSVVREEVASLTLPLDCELATDKISVSFSPGSGLASAGGGPAPAGGEDAEPAFLMVKAPIAAGTRQGACMHTCLFACMRIAPNPFFRV